MFASLIPAFTGMMAIALLPNTGKLWLRWFLYQITTFGTLPGLRKFLDCVPIIMVADKTFSYLDFPAL